MNHKFSLISTDYTLTPIPALQKTRQQICHAGLSVIHALVSSALQQQQTNKANEGNSCIPDSWCSGVPLGEVLFWKALLMQHQQQTNTDNINSNFYDIMRSVSLQTHLTLYMLGVHIIIFQKLYWVIFFVTVIKLINVSSATWMFSLNKAVLLLFYFA